MVVQHNMQAVNANRQLNLTTQAQQKSTEKLSSGYRINRAGDDAAGLAISEKMRKQIKGLDRASTNAQDGVSAVQTAEGALNEVQSMLQRMNELAVQSANGTNSVSDRTALQNEIDQLTTEIDRVSETTKFNETYLLKGDKAVTKGVRFTYGQYGAGVTNSTNQAANSTQSAAVSFGASALTSYNNATSQAQGINTSAGGGIGFDASSNLAIQVTFASSSIDTIAANYIPASNAANNANPPAGSSTLYGSSVADAHQDDQNALAKSIRDSGLSVSQTNTWDATAGDYRTTYKLELTGDAAQKYDVVALTTGNQLQGTASSPQGYGVFAIQTKGGETIALVTVGGGNAQTATDTSQVHTSSAVISSTSATAAKTTGHGESTEYFDKDGNRISNNALSRYFSASDGTTNANVQVRGDAPQVYDAVGNLTSLKAGNVNMIRDLTGALNVSLHVGADATQNNKITLNIENMSSKNLGVNGLRIDGSDSTNADLAIETIKEALQKVSDQRAELGAVQNRLEHTINNLDNVVENTEAAESRIRDTDMAEEMVTYSKNNILAQAGQSMLAQANQSNQGVLSLLG